MFSDRRAIALVEGFGVRAWNHSDHDLAVAVTAASGFHPKGICRKDRRRQTRQRDNCGRQARLFHVYHHFHYSFIADAARAEGRRQASTVTDQDERRPVIWMLVLGFYLQRR